MTEEWGIKLAEVKRHGGRESYSDLRAIHIETGQLRSCAGSARLRQGKTSVLAAVRVELRQEVQIVIRRDGKPRGTPERYMETVVGKAVRAVLGANKPPISVLLMIESDDGSALSCCVNAAIMALADGGFQFEFWGVAVTICMVEDSLLLVDPTKEESNAGRSVCIVIQQETNSWILALPEASTDDAAGEIKQKNAAAAAKKSGEKNMHHLAAGCASILAEKMRSAMMPNFPILCNKNIAQF